MKKLIINTDGGARGNPGPAGIGVVFSDDKGRIIAEYQEFIGNATNNVAEYKALILALEKAQNFKFEEAECRLDSELVVKQINGIYRVKESTLKGLFEKAQALIFFRPVKFVHVPREENQEADRLVNVAIDTYLKS